MKKSILPFLLCIILGFACQDNNDPASACGVNDPVENIPWLKQLAENSENESSEGYSYIAQAKFNGKRVFYLGSCCPFCNWALRLFDCEGNLISDEVNFEDLEDTEIIWQPDNSQCSFD